ncbi:MAG: hypothetical protein LUC97_03980 [Clostridiales bacterium]|nr:hypothetical protein [Clostridiales bacterium]
MELVRNEKTHVAKYPNESKYLQEQAEKIKTRLIKRVNEEEIKNIISETKFYVYEEWHEPKSDMSGISSNVLAVIPNTFFEKSDDKYVGYVYYLENSIYIYVKVIRNCMPKNSSSFDESILKQIIPAKNNESVADCNTDKLIGSILRGIANLLLAKCNNKFKDIEQAYSYLNEKYC